MVADNDAGEIAIASGSEAWLNLYLLERRIWQEEEFEWLCLQWERMFEFEWLWLQWERMFEFERLWLQWERSF